MSRPAIVISIMGLLLWNAAACAEPVMNKCTDGKRLTYTDKPCEKLGLKAAGPIKDTITIVPAVVISGDARREAQHGEEGAAAGKAVPGMKASKLSNPQTGKLLNR